MEVAVNLAAEGVSMHRGERSATATRAANSGDIFLMLIQNLIDNTDVQITEGMTELLSSQSGVDEDENLLAGFAGMLLQNPENIPVDILNLLSEGETQNGGILEAISGNKDNGAAALAAVKLMSLFRDENGKLILPQSETLLPNGESGSNAGEEKANQAVQTAFENALLKTEVTEVSYTEQGVKAADVLGERQFRSAIDEVKQSLGAEGAKDDGKKTSEIDVDALGANKPNNIFEYGLKTAAEKKPNEVFGQSLAEQVKESVNENIALGNKEFTMKLKPASLGEVTVKLIEKDGKTVLDITTATAETAKKINEDIAALRDAVRPMAVEVHEATTHRTEASTQSELNQQFNMFSQQQQLDGQRHGAYQFGGTERAERAISDDFAEAIVENQQERRTALESELDTYV